MLPRVRGLDVDPMEVQVAMRWCFLCCHCIHKIVADIASIPHNHESRYQGWWMGQMGNSTLPLLKVWAVPTKDRPEGPREVIRAFKCLSSCQ